jgi:hypothetical protein
MLLEGSVRRDQGLKDNPVEKHDADIILLS